MKRKIIAITILSIVTGLLILNLVKTKDTEVKKTQKQVNNTNMLTMMLETEAGTGNYEETTASEWPQDGYIFNESLSRCENGGTLSWDDNAKKVIMKANNSDKCYVYFDQLTRYLIITDSFEKDDDGRNVSDIYLNNVNITDNINQKIPYEVGDVLKYYHERECPRRGIELKNANNQVIAEIDARVQGIYHEYILTGEERYVTEYWGGICAPI